MKVSKVLIPLAGVAIIATGVFLITRKTETTKSKEITNSANFEVKDFCPLKVSYDSKAITQPTLEPAAVTKNSTNYKMKIADSSKKQFVDLTCASPTAQAEPIKNYFINNYDANKDLADKIAKSKDEIAKLDLVEFFKRYVEKSNPTCKAKDDLSSLDFIGNKLKSDYQANYVLCENSAAKSKAYYIMPKSPTQNLVTISNYNDKLNKSVLIDF